MFSVVYSEVWALTSCYSSTLSFSLPSPPLLLKTATTLFLGHTHGEFYMLHVHAVLSHEGTEEPEVGLLQYEGVLSSSLAPIIVAACYVPHT